jgi:hypothetical protein
VATGSALDKHDLCLYRERNGAANCKKYNLCGC